MSCIMEQNTTADVRHICVSFSGFWYNLPYNPRTILDAGANCGFASRVAQRLWPDTLVIALEPDSGNVDLIHKNFEGYSNLHCEKVRA